VGGRREERVGHGGKGGPPPALHRVHGAQADAAFASAARLPPGPRPIPTPTLPTLTPNPTLNPTQPPPPSHKPSHLHEYLLVRQLPLDALLGGGGAVGGGSGRLVGGQRGEAGRYRAGSRPPG
jgi:hypothetical protein